MKNWSCSLPFNFILRDLGMNRRDIYAIVALCLLLYLIDDGLGLRHIARPANHFDVPTPDHYAVHLLERQLRRLGYLVLDKREPLVLLRNRIPRHVDRLDGAKRQECLPDCVLLQLEAYAPHIYPKPNMYHESSLMVREYWTLFHWKGVGMWVSSFVQFWIIIKKCNTKVGQLGFDLIEVLLSVV